MDSRAGATAASPAVTGARLLERDHELRQLRAAIDATERGGGSLTVIEGPAGIGKSQLLRAARRMARERGVAVLSARPAEIERSDAFGVAGKLVGDQGLQEGGSHDLRAGEVEARARAVVVAALERAVGERPTLLAVDDLQWCDRESLAVLHDAVDRLEDRACAIVLARRPRGTFEPELLQQVVRSPDATVLRLRPLGESSVAALLARELGRDAEPAFVRACLESCGGNPFLLRELMLELDARGLEPTAAHALSVPALGPQAVAEIVARRLHGASEGARALAEAVAVLGNDADREAVLALVGRDPPEVHDATQELAAAAIFASEGKLAFAHAIVHAAVLSTLRPSALAARHRDAARALAAAGASSEAVGRHLMLSDPEGDSAVVDGLRAAAAKALERGAPDAAARLLDRALREPPVAAVRAEVEFELGTALAAGGRSEAIAHLEAALASLADPLRRADAALRLARMQKVTSRYAEIKETLRAALAEEVPDPARRFRLRVELASELAFRAGPEEALEQLEAIEREAPAGSEGAVAVLRAMVAHGLCRQTVRREQSVSLARQALAGDWLTREENAISAMYARMALVAGDRVVEALAGLEAELARAVKSGAAFNRLTCMMAAIWALTIGGRLDEAIALGDEALALADRVSSLVGAALAGTIAQPLLAAGRVDDARRLLEDRFDPTAADPARDTYLITGFAARSVLHSTTGHHVAALADAERCRDLLARSRSDNPALEPWRSHAAAALVGLGESDRAAVLAEEELAAASRWGGRRAIARALRSLAACRQAGAVALLRDAEATLVDCEALLERTAVDVALGEALADAGDHAGARERLQRGLVAAERCGAQPLVTRARDALIAAGARPRRAASGPESLTAAERRVAELAATGASNAAIADQLVVSTTTVRTHLRTAFKKLGVSSRSQLAAALDDR